MTTMPPFHEIFQRARSGSPFSNGTEGAAWEAAWCLRDGAPCRHDTILRGGDLSCPLMEVALLGETPAEWGERHNVLGRGMYECTLYEAEPQCAN